MLRYDHRRTGRETREEPYQQVYRGSRPAPYRGKGSLAEELADYHSIHRVVELLEESPQ